MNQTTTRADNPGMNHPDETLGVEEMKAAPEVPGKKKTKRPGLSEAPKWERRTVLRPAAGRMTLAPLSVVQRSVAS